MIMKKYNEFEITCAQICEIRPLNSFRYFQNHEASMHQIMPKNNKCILIQAL